MMDASFIAAIQKSTATGVVTLDGKEYATREVHNPPLPEQPTCDHIEVSSLSALTAYVRAQLEPGGELHDQHCIVHVENPRAVRVVSGLKGARRLREHFIAAAVIGEPFPFGRFIPHADFMIALQSRFIDYGDRAAVMQKVGTIKDETVKTSSDDGISQRVTASAGMVLVQEIALPLIVTLRPFRTFLEVDQPPSSFVLRVQQNAKALPSLALFEADGGRWQQEAVDNICEYLTDALKDTGVLLIA